MPTPRLVPSLGVTALVLLPVLGGCGEDTGAADAPVVVPQSDTTTVSGSEVEVLVPAGGWTFTVGEPVDELPEAAADELDGPAGEGRWVGVSWLPTATAPLLGPTLQGTSPLDADVRVSDDRGTTGLTTLGPGGESNGGGAAWVQVGDDARLEVSYDGLTQTVDLDDATVEPGAAAGFYVEGPVLREQCVADGTTGEVPVEQPTCEVVGVATPYVAGLGWVDGPEETWWVLDVRTGPVRAVDPAASYRVEQPDGVVRTAEAEGTVLAEDWTLDGGWSATAAVAADATSSTPAELALTWTLTGDGGTGSTPADGEAAATWTVELPPRAPTAP